MTITFAHTKHVILAAIEKSCRMRNSPLNMMGTFLDCSLGIQAYFVGLECHKLYE